jgi:hypothetical protein
MVNQNAAKPSNQPEEMTSHTWERHVYAPPEIALHVELHRISFCQSFFGSFANTGTK